MRDILLTLVVLGLIVQTVRRAEYGAYLWTWLSMMSPHQLTYGFAQSLPWAQVSAILTLGMLPFTKARKPLPINGGIVLLLLLWAWMTVTSIVTINPTTMVWERWFFVFKIFLMLLATLMLIRGRTQINILIGILLFSVGFFGVKGGLYTLLTGGSGRVYGPPGGMLEENNAFAVALVMLLPLMYYVRTVPKNRWLRHGLTACVVLMGASILGSQSRGALVALLAMATVLGIKSRYPLRFSLVLVVLIAAGIAFMPDSWTQRMDTIQNYGDDNSAMSRLYTWRTLWNVAMERPFTGAGFRSDVQEIFDRFAPVGPEFAVFLGKRWVAHSIYFQALGEHGFIGLFLFVSIWIWVWVAAGRTAKAAEKVDGLKDWLPLLMRMCQVSTMGYCAGGAFLSLMVLDLPYYVLAIVTLGRCALKDHQRDASLAVRSPFVRPSGAPSPATSAMPIGPGMRLPGSR